MDTPAFFLSKEWEDWKSCEQPNQEEWSDKKCMMAAAQRNIAEIYQLRVDALTMWSTDDPTYGQRQLDEIEAEARAHMLKVNVGQLQE